MIQKVKNIVNFIKTEFDGDIEFGLVLGSGLGIIADEIEKPFTVRYCDIPGFPISTVEGHEGLLVIGYLKGKCVMAFKGRFHLYEGREIEDVILPVRIFQLMGIKKVILTNAAGGVNSDFKQGDLMIIRDHISFFSPSPLAGPDSLDFGVRFPDMTSVYDSELRKKAESAAVKLGIDIREGVYFFSRGPQYETPAEIIAIRSLGGDAVGMSTVPEAIAAVQGGIKVLGISCITNMASGMIEGKLKHSDVINTANNSKQNFKKLIYGILGE